MMIGTVCTLGNRFCGHPRPVPRTFHPLVDHVHRDRFQVVRPTDLREEIDRHGGRIQFVVAQLGGLVVPWENVVVVVPTLAERGQSHVDVLRGSDGPKIISAINIEWSKALAMVKKLTCRTACCPKCARHCSPAT